VFKAKLIGILEVGEARGDRMCQEALQDLKIAIRAAGEHKQKITIHVTIEGLRLRDEKTGVSDLQMRKANSARHSLNLQYKQIFVFFLLFVGIALSSSGAQNLLHRPRHDRLEIFRVHFWVSGLWAPILRHQDGQGG
jgi:hypothetical protein